MKESNKNYTSKKGFKIILSVGLILIILSIISCTIIIILNANKPKAKDDDELIQLTDAEVIKNAKIKLSKKYYTENIYADVALDNYIFVYNYKVHLAWYSSDSEIINQFTGKVTRNLTAQQCTLTVKLSYNELIDYVVFNYKLPAREYKLTDPKFKTNGPELQISLAYLGYDENDNLITKLYIYNNYTDERIITGIQNLTFSISESSAIADYFSYLIKDYSYENETVDQFICNYGEYKIITLPIIPNNQLITKFELADKKPFLRINDNVDCYIQ